MDGSLANDHLIDPLSAWLAEPNESTKDGLQRLRAAATVLRDMRWPAPFDQTRHEILEGNSKEIRALVKENIDLVVTSPPYWTLKQYSARHSQLGDVEDYEQFIAELESVFSACASLLVPGGRMCINVGDVCLSRKEAGRHYVMPLHADIQVMARRIGLDCLTPIIWQKIANGKNEVKRSSAGFYGKPFQPGAIVKNDVEYILFLRKPGAYRQPTPMQKALSLLTPEEMKLFWRTSWTDIRGVSTKGGHPAPYPVSLAERLIRMFSFAGDRVLDPFAGSGTTGVAAMRWGRSSVQVELSNEYYVNMVNRMSLESRSLRKHTAEVVTEVR